MDDISGNHSGTGDARADPHDHRGIGELGLYWTEIVARAIGRLFAGKSVTELLNFLNVGGKTGNSRQW